MEKVSILLPHSIWVVSFLSWIVQSNLKRKFKKIFSNLDAERNDWCRYGNQMLRDNGVNDVQVTRRGN